MFRTRYRIKKVNAYYQSEYRHWWLPFYSVLRYYHVSIEEAVYYIEEYKTNRVVKYL